MFSPRKSPGRSKVLGGGGRRGGRRGRGGEGGGRGGGGRGRGKGGGRGGGRGGGGRRSLPLSVEDYLFGESSVSIQEWN